MSLSRRFTPLPAAALLIFLTAFGCRPAADTANSEYEARFGVAAPRVAAHCVSSVEPILLDGRLDEPAWQRAPVYPLTFPWGAPGATTPKVRAALARMPFEAARVRFCHDKKNLYFGVELDDCDIVNYDKSNGTRFFMDGDTVEIFLKSDKYPEYYELYAGPHGNITTMKLASRQYTDLYHRSPVDSRFRTAVRCDGTINAYRDRDSGWTVEAAVPLTMLESLTEHPFSPDDGWTVLIARYNYTYGQVATQVSAFPQLPEVNHHLSEYYSALILEPAAPARK